MAEVMDEFGMGDMDHDEDIDDIDDIDDIEDYDEEEEDYDEEEEDINEAEDEKWSKHEKNRKREKKARDRFRKQDEFEIYERNKEKEKKEGARMKQRFGVEIEKLRRKEIDKVKKVTNKYNEKKKLIEEKEEKARTEELPPLEKELLDSAIDAFYKRNNSRVPENIHTIDIYRDRDVKGRRILMVKDPTGKSHRLSFYKGLGDEQFRAKSTLKSAYLVRDVLQIESTKPVDIVNEINEINISPDPITSEQGGQDLLETANKVETTLKEINTPNLDEMKTTKEEIANDLSKLAETNKLIAKEEKKLEQAKKDNNKDQIDKINKKIKDLESERSARLEGINTNREKLRSQISRIKQTIHKILNEDTTLAEKIKTLFKEQGVTIATILTALGLTVGVIVQAFTGGSTSPPPNETGGAKEWIKKQLKYLGKLLSFLAGKAVAALPGIIGSIVSWLLTTTKDVVNWFANNLWMLLVFIVGALFVAAKEYINISHK